VRTSDVHGLLEHGAVPSAEPWSSLTNVRSCTVNPAGTGPVAPGGAGCAEEAEAVGFAVGLGEVGWTLGTDPVGGAGDAG
jgi:hypothetical protein